MKQQQIQSLAGRTILACLAKAPFLRAKMRRTQPKAGFGPGLVMDVSGKGIKNRTLLVEIRSNGQPRIIRDAIAQLAMYGKNHIAPYSIIAAPYISEQSAAICKNAGAGYVDLKGNCFLAFDSVYIERSGIPNNSEKRDLRQIYSPRAERALRTLLADVSKPWRLKDLARTSGISIGHASNVKSRLEQGEFLDTGANGFRVARPAELLEQWAKNYSLRKSVVYRFWSPLKPEELEAGLFAYARKEGLQCALTGFSAGAVYAPMVIMPRVFAYCGGDINKAAEALRLKAVDSGENVQLIEPYDNGVFIGSRTLSGKILVSPAQAYLDLIAMGGRGAEAAKAIMEQTLKW